MQRLNLDIAHDEFVALVGPSGVGKSTLLRVIAGLMPPASGQVVVEPPHEPDCRQIGFVFQDTRLLPRRKVLANVEYGLEDLLKSQIERRARAQAALSLVGLTDYADRWPHQLSGGQKQRVAIARALAVRTALLLIDEPFSALDPTTRQSLQDELLRLWRESGTPHYPRHARYERSHISGRQNHCSERQTRTGGAGLSCSASPPQSTSPP